MNDYLKKLRQNAEMRRVPIISRQTEYFLKEQLLKYKPRHCIEIGSAIWYSTIFVASLMQDWNGQVTSFEVAYPAYLEALMHIKESKLHNITLYPFDIVTSDVRKFVPKKWDFFFVDWQKSQYWLYMHEIENIKEENSLIVIDDVIKFHNKLDWLYEYLSKKQINYQILPMEEGDGIMVIGL